MEYYLVSNKKVILKKCKSLLQLDQVYKRYVETDLLVHGVDSSKDYQMMIKLDDEQKAILIKDYELI